MVHTSLEGAPAGVCLYFQQRRKRLTGLLRRGYGPVSESDLDVLALLVGRDLARGERAAREDSQLGFGGSANQNRAALSDRTLDGEWADGRRARTAFLLHSHDDLNRVERWLFQAQ